MTIQPTCSALIPCYNAEDFLPRVIKSLKEQTYPFSEVILFDDNSSDNSIEIAEQYNVRVISSKLNKNMGPSYARNRLLESTTSEWVHFHDADDLLEPTFLEKLIESDTKNFDIVTSSADWRDEVNDSVQVKRRYSQELLSLNPLEATVSNPIGVVSTIIRKQSLIDINGFDESVCCWEDGDLYVRLARENNKFKVVDEVLAYSIRHGGGISSEQYGCATARLRFLEIYLNEYKINNEIFLEEIEKVAAQFVKLKKYKKCKEAVLLALHNGGDLPITSNKALHFLKSMIPNYLLYIFQQKIHNC